MQIYSSSGYNDEARQILASKGERNIIFLFYK
jgi:hypothetical protein